MKATHFILSLLAGLATAAPTAIDIRQTANVGITEHEYTIGGCRDIIFFFARGSTEVGNVGSTVGPPTGQGLKNAFGDSRVAVEGVDYAALLSTNFLRGGADPAGIQEMKGLFTGATSKCPNSILVGGGYSQGAALVHRAIENLASSVKNKITGIVTYGDTQNLQDRGQIRNFPREKILVICNIGDLICQGTLTILAPHLDYTRRVPEAVAFLTGKIRGTGLEG